MARVKNVRTRSERRKLPHVSAYDVTQNKAKDQKDVAPPLHKVDGSHLWVTADCFPVKRLLIPCH